MTFIGDDEIEGMNGDFDFVRILVDFFTSEDGLTTKEVDGHSLNRANVDERASRFWILQIVGL